MRAHALLSESSRRITGKTSHPFSQLAEAGTPVLIQAYLHTLFAHRGVFVTARCGDQPHTCSVQSLWPMREDGEAAARDVPPFAETLGSSQSKGDRANMEADLVLDDGVLPHPPTFSVLLSAHMPSSRPSARTISTKRRAPEIGELEEESCHFAAELSASYASRG